MAFDESDRARLEAISARNRASKQRWSAAAQWEDGKKVKPSKYRNVRTEVDGLPFASKREAAYYVKLTLAARRGELWFIRQPSFDLPGGVKYRADFLVVYPDRVEVVDVKGVETEAFKIKRRLVESQFPFKLVVISRERK